MYCHMSILCYIHHLYSPHVPSHVNIVLYPPSVLSPCTITCQYCIISTICTVPMYRHMSILYYIHHLHCPHVPSHVNIVLYPPSVLSPCTVTCQYCIISTICTCTLMSIFYYIHPLYHHMSILYYIHHLYCPHVLSHVNIVLYSPSVQPSCTITCQYCIISTICTVPHVPSHVNIVLYPPSVQSPCTVTCQYCIISTICTVPVYHHMSILYYIHHLYCPHVLSHVNIVLYPPSVQPSCTITCQYCIISTICTVPVYHHMSILYYIHHLYCPHVLSHVNIVLYSPSVQPSCTITCQYCIISTICTVPMYHHMSILYYIHHMYCPHVPLTCQYCIISTICTVPMYHHMSILYYIHHLYCPHVPSHVNIVLYPPSVLSPCTITCQYCIISTICTVPMYCHMSILYYIHHLYCPSCTITCQYCIISTICTVPMYRHMSILYYIHHLYCPHVPSHVNIVLYPPSVLSHVMYMYRHMSILYYIHHLYCPHVPSHVNIVLYPPSVLSPCTITCQYCIISTICTVPMYHHMSILYYIHHLYSPHVPSHVNIVLYPPSVLSPCTITCQYCIISTICTVPMYRHMSILYYIHHLYCPHVPSHVNIVLYPPSVLSPCTVTCQYCVIFTICTALMYHHMSILYYIHHLCSPSCTITCQYCIISTICTVPHVPSHVNIVLYPPSVLSPCTITCQYCIISTICYCPHVLSHVNIVLYSPSVQPSCTITCQYCIISTICTVPMYHHMSILYYIHHLYCPHVPLHVNIVLYPPSALSPCTITCQYCIISTICTVPHVPSHVNIVLYPPSVLSHVLSHVNIVLYSPSVQPSCTITCQYCIISTICTVPMYRYMSILYYIHHLYCPSCTITCQYCIISTICTVPCTVTCQYCVIFTICTALMYHHMSILYYIHHLYCPRVPSHVNIVLYPPSATVPMYHHMSILYYIHHLYCPHVPSHVNIVLFHHLYSPMYHHMSILYYIHHLYCPHVLSHVNIVLYPPSVLSLMYHHMSILYYIHHLYCPHVLSHVNIVLYPPSVLSLMYHHMSILYYIHHLYCPHVLSHVNIVLYPPSVLSPCTVTCQYCIISTICTALMYHHMSILYYIHHLYCPHLCHMSILYYIHHLYCPRVPSHVNIVLYPPYVLSPCTVTCQYCVISTICTALMYHHMSILYYIHHLYCPHVPSHVNIVLYPPSVLSPCTITCQYCIISTICTVPMYHHMSILYYIHHLYSPSCTITCQYCIISTICTVPMYHHMSILYYIHHLYCPHVPSHVNIVLYTVPMYHHMSILYYIHHLYCPHVPSHVNIVLYPHVNITCQYCIISTICTVPMYHHMSILYYIHHLYCPHVPSHVNIVLYPPSVLSPCTVTCQYCVIFTICTALMYHHMSILYYIHHLYCPHVPSHVNIVLYPPSVLSPCTVTCQYCIISTICTVPMYHHMSILYYIHQYCTVPMYCHMSILCYIHHLYSPHVPSHVNIVLYPPSVLSPCTITCQYCIISTICTVPMYCHMSILYYIHHLYCPHVPSHVNIVLYPPSVQPSCTITCQYCIISTICTALMYHPNIVLYPPSALSPCTITCQYCIISTICTVPMYCHMSILYYIHHLYSPHVPSHVNIVLYPPSVLSYVLSRIISTICHVPSHVNIVLYPPSVLSLMYHHMSILYYIHHLYNIVHPVPMYCHMSILYYIHHLYSPHVPCTTCQYCIISTICTVPVYHHMSILYYIHHLYCPHVLSHVNIVLYSPSVQPSCTITCQYCIISTICTVPMYHHMSILYYIHHLYCPRVPLHVNIVLYPPSALSPCTITCQYCIISTICTVPMHCHMSILCYIHHLYSPHVPSHVNIVLYPPSVQSPCTVTCQYCIISTICTALMYHHMSILYYIHHLHCPHVPSHVNIVLYPPSALSPCTVTCQYCVIFTICTALMYHHMSILYYIHHLYCPHVPSHVNIVLYPPSVLSPCTVTCQYCIISTICTVPMYHHMSILYYIHHLYSPHVPSHVNIVLYPPSVLSHVLSHVNIVLYSPSVQPSCTITCQYCIISTICTVPMYRYMSILYYIHHLYCPHVPSHVNIVLYPPSVLSHVLSHVNIVLYSPSVQPSCTITCQYCIISTICTVPVYHHMSILYYIHHLSVPMYHHMSILYYIHHLYSPHVPSHVNIVLYPPSVLSPCTITCQYCIISTICTVPMYCHMSILYYIHHLYSPHVPSHVNIVLYPPSVLSPCTVTCQYCIISTICTVPVYHHMSILYYIHHLYCPHVLSHVNIVLYSPSVQPSCTITCQYCIISTICTVPMYHHMSILYYIHHLYCPRVPLHVNIVLYPPSALSPCTITCQYCIISTICTVPMHCHMSILCYIHHLYSPHVPSHVNIVLYPPSVQSPCTVTCQYCIISTICTALMYHHMSILYYIHHLHCPHVPSHVNIVLYPPSALSPCTVTCQYCVIFTICTALMYHHMSILYYIHHLYCPHVPSHVNIVLYPPSVLSPCTVTCQYCIISTICTVPMYHHMSILYYIHHLYSPQVPSHVNIVLYPPSVLSHVLSHVNIVLYSPSVQPSCTITCQYCIISTICTVPMYRYMSILYYIHHLYCPSCTITCQYCIISTICTVPCTVTCQYCVIFTICTALMYHHMSILYYIHHLYCPRVPSHVNIVLYPPLLCPHVPVTCQYCIYIPTICAIYCSPHVPSHVNIVLYPPSVLSPCTVTCQYCIISTICTVPMYHHMSILYYIHHLYCPICTCTIMSCQYCVIISTICTVPMYCHMSCYIHHLYTCTITCQYNTILTCDGT